MAVSRDPAAADLNAQLDSLAIAVEAYATDPIPAPEQQDFSAFYHS
jgi:hypothetical protein